MVLRVTDSNEDFGIGTIVVSLEHFGMKEYHPLIASKQWTCVYLDLTEKTPRGKVTQLLQRTKIIPVFDKDNVTPRVLQLLCEIVPDYTGKLRSSYVNDKETFNTIIDRLITERWS